MRTSEHIKEIAGALAKAQAEMGRVLRDKTAKVQTKTGGSYSFDYADLASVLDVVKAALSKNGIAVIQAAGIEGDKVHVETRLAHASGEWIESTLAIKPDDLSPQKIGSAVTYARRYALSAMVGVASEEDDDGNAAEGNHATTTRRQTSDDAAAKLRANRQQIADPKARTQAVLSQFKKRWGDEARARLGHVIGRTIPGNVTSSEIVLSEEELTKAEAAATLGQAHDNGARA